MGELIGKGMAKIGSSGVEGLDTSRANMVSPCASSFHDYFDYKACV